MIELISDLNEELNTKISAIKEENMS